MNTTLTGEAPACASKPRTPVSREHFEAMLQDDALISAADSALVLQARAEIVTEIVLGYQTRLLAENRWQINPDLAVRGRGAYEVILQPSISYLLKDDDFNQYQVLCLEEASKAGLKVQHSDGCPKIDADNSLRDAQHLLLNLAAPYTGISADDASVTLELRSKLLDLVLGTLAKKLDPHKRFGIPKPEQKNGAFSNAAA